MWRSNNQTDAKVLGTMVDGIVSQVSDIVKELERAMNDNKLPW